MRYSKVSIYVIDIPGITNQSEVELEQNSPHHSHNKLLIVPSQSTQSYCSPQCEVN